MISIDINIVSHAYINIVSQTYINIVSHTYINVVSHTYTIIVHSILACNNFPLDTFSFSWQYVFGQVLFHSTDLLRKVCE
jgi:hypothetical protein